MGRDPPRGHPNYRSRKGANGMSWFIFDIDGTLANNTHRLHLLPYNRETDPNSVVDNTAAQWDEFNGAAAADSVYPAISTIYRAIGEAGYRIALITGRTELIRTITTNWLFRMGLDRYHELYMRPEDDYCSDYILKQRIMKTNFKGRHIQCVFEDRDRVVQMYRENDIQCVQVRKGDY